MDESSDPRDAVPVGGEGASAAALEKIRNLLAQDQPALAYLQYERARRELPHWHLPAAELVRIIRGLVARHDSEKSIPLMVEFLKRSADDAPRMRLMLARVLVRDAKRPSQALAVLAKIPPGSMTPELEQTRQGIELEAHLKLAVGNVEPALDDW